MLEELYESSGVNNDPQNINEATDNAIKIMQQLKKESYVTLNPYLKNEAVTAPLVSVFQQGAKFLAEEIMPRFIDDLSPTIADQEALSKLLSEAIDNILDAAGDSERSTILDVATKYFNAYKQQMAPQEGESDIATAIKQYTSQEIDNLLKIIRDK